MRIGAFQMRSPLPDCHEPWVLATLRPWIDVNSVGTLLLNELEERFDAEELGRLARPGLFYDFTRYRPTIHLDDGIRDLTVPNTTIHYARREGLNDLLLLRLLEPHANAEFYVDSIVRLISRLGARKYIVLGSMYDAVPHTRPLIVSGYAMGKDATKDLKKAGTLPISYHGPSTMANLITRKAAEAGIDATVFIVSLPQYVVLSEDYLGMVRLMEILNMLYGIPVSETEFARALEQRRLINERVEGSTEVKILLPQLESAYDTRIKEANDRGASQLSPEMEAILWKMMGENLGKA